MKNSLVKVQKWKKSKSGKLYLGSVWINPNKDKKEPKEKKTISVQKRRLILANKAPLITSVEPLKLTRDNYVGVIKQEYARLHDYIRKNNGITCNCLKAKITRLNTKHEYLKNGYRRPFADIVDHASYIPFIVPVLKTGVTSKKLCRTMNNGDSSFEVIGRAEVSNNGNKQRIGVSVVIVKSKENGVYTKVSVFKLTDINGVIKSLLTTTLRRSIYLKRRINLFCNDSIALKRENGVIKSLPITVLRKDRTLKKPNLCNDSITTKHEKGIIKSLHITTPSEQCLSQSIDLHNNLIKLRCDTDKQYCNNSNDSNAPLSNVEYIYL